MPTHAAFLRGINLRGRRATGDMLRAPFEELGFDEVNVFRASGNVVFASARKPATARIEEALEAALGYEVAVILRTGDEVRAIARHRPFDPELVERSNGKLQVWLLARKPTAAVQEELLAYATDEDRLAFGERELYWLPSGNMRDSGLDVRGIEKRLGTTTMRTKGTMEQIAAKYFG